MTGDPQNIQQLRERLRALGYLDARVDRYVLGSAATGAGRTRFAIAAGLRVGVVAGAMLGVSAAIALAAWAPGFISTPSAKQTRLTASNRRMNSRSPALVSSSAKYNARRT